MLHEEEQHLFKALRKCKYPIWAINRAKLKSQNPNRIKQRRINNQNGPRNTNNQNLYMVAPYHQGLSKRVKKHAANMGYRYISKEDKQSKASLWLPRTMILLPAKVESYRDINAMSKGVEKNTWENLEEPLLKGFKEHQKPPSPKFDHCNTSGHQNNINKFTIVGREDQNLIRAIKEAILIRVNDPSLNKNIGKYHLPHIWDEVLLKISELKLKH